MTMTSTTLNSYDFFINDNTTNNINYHHEFNTTQDFTITDNSSAFSNISSHPPAQYAPAVAIRVLARFHLIAVPAIVILGILGNALSFCIFISKTLRRTSCSLYLAARCVSDTGFLLSVFITWLGDAMNVPVIHTVGICQMVVFASYVFGFLSVWLVVCITLENYIRICHPFSVAKYCTVQKAKRVLLGLVVVSVALYQFPLWMTQVTVVGGRQLCGNRPEFLHLFQIVVYTDLVITLILPSLVILFFMGAIALSLVRSWKRQSRLTGGSVRVPNTSHHPHPPNNTTTTTATINGMATPGQGQDGHQGQTQDQGHSPGQGQDLAQGQTNGNHRISDTQKSSTMTKVSPSPPPLSPILPPSSPASVPSPHPSATAKVKANAAKRRSVRGTAQARVTRLLFAVSFTFLVLSLPSHIVRLRMVVMMMVREASTLSPTLEEMLQVVFQILYYLSFAVNLLVYLSCGESFRNVFVETYINCLVGRQFRRRRSEQSRTSYSMVRTEAPENAEKAEGETKLVT